ncbi:MAG: hypothetical protein ACM3P1_08795 [Candidatus Saccharibacteria bacterium]
MKEILLICILLHLCLAPIAVMAQSVAETDNIHQLIGKRYIPPVYYKGPQYLYSDADWIPGTVYLTNGDSVAHLFLKYNRMQDELIYFNQKNNTAVRLDKKQLLGFALGYGDRPTVFRKIAHIHASNKAGYYEVLYNGKTDVLAQRRSELKICPTYTSKSGVKKDRQFVAYDRYLISGKENELLPIRLRKKSLLLKFGDSKKKEVSRTIRRLHLSMKDEPSMIHAWEALEAQGYSPVF